MSMRNTMFAAGLALATPAYAEEPVKLEFGYNALELGATSDEALRARIIDNVVASFGPLSIGHGGMNQIEGSNYFGYNSFTVSGRGWKQAPVVATKGTNDGIFDTKYGVRDTSLVERLGGYGWLNVVGNENAGEVVWLYGKPLGKHSLEWVQFSEFGNGKPAFFTELQGNLQVGKHVNLFGRVEAAGFRSPKYIAGVAIKK